MERIATNRRGNPGVSSTNLPAERAGYAHPPPDTRTGPFDVQIQWACFYSFYSFCAGLRTITISKLVFGPELRHAGISSRDSIVIVLAERPL